MRYYLSSLLCFFCILNASAQVDTTKKQTIEIISSFKPVMRSAAKINFSASQLNVDSAKNLRPYEMPSQSLYYFYRSASIKPVAMEQESGPNLGISNFAKVGFGSYTTPYLQAGVGTGDGSKYFVNAYLNYISSKGSTEFQQYSQINAKAAGSYFIPKNELYGSIGLRRDNYYLYGYDHNAFHYDRKDVLQQQKEITISAGIRNTEKGPVGINYNPNFIVSSFSMKDKASETTLIFDLPAQKKITDALSVDLSIKGDMTRYSNERTSQKFSNNVFRIDPSLSYVKNPLNLHVGVSAAEDNGKLKWLPAISAELKWMDEFSILVGYLGHITKNTYKSLSFVNPYTEPIINRLNTTDYEYYVGVHANIGKHFSFEAKSSFISYTNLQLFINDTAAGGKGFLVLNASQANNFRIHGSASYINQDKFTITGAITLNAYKSLPDSIKKAYHLLPVEINGSMRWQALKKVTIKGDLYMFSGSSYLTRDGKPFKVGSGIDLSAGVEYAIKKNFSAWLDINNIFNDKYARWHDYPVYGINLLGGVMIHF